jgi:hypothetical protein
MLAEVEVVLPTMYTSLLGPRVVAVGSSLPVPPKNRSGNSGTTYPSEAAWATKMSKPLVRGGSKGAFGARLREEVVPTITASPSLICVTALMRSMSEPPR